MTGTVYLVGAGPGAPDLLTVRAANLLARADIVFHDALVHADTLALAVRAERVAVGKRCGKHSTAQRFISKRLVEAASTHATVVRLILLPALIRLFGERTWAVPRWLDRILPRFSTH